MIERSHELLRRITLEAPLSQVFDFFRRAENLDRITPPWLRFRMTSSPQITMGLGTRIGYSLKLNGIRFVWKSEITLWEPPTAFEDTQIKGPYSFWVHRHSFQETDEGTRVTDRVRYAVPGAYFEPIVHSLFVRPRLEAIFDFREKVLRQIFSGTGDPDPDRT